MDAPGPGSALMTSLQSQVTFPVSIKMLQVWRLGNERRIWPEISPTKPFSCKSQPFACVWNTKSAPIPPLMEFPHGIHTSRFVHAGNRHTALPVHVYPAGGDSTGSKPKWFWSHHLQCGAIPKEGQPGIFAHGNRDNPFWHVALSAVVWLARC